MSNAITIPQSRVGQKFIMFSAAVMGLQFLFGIIAAAQYVWPNLLFHIAPFNFTRMLHINTLVVSLLAGFMGATYFLIAEEAGGKLHSEKLANLNFWLTFGGIGAVVAGYLYLNFTKTYSLWLSEGREYIEAPRWAYWAIVGVVVLFLFNIIQTIRKRAAWDDITRMLVIGLAALGGIYLFGMFFFANLSVDQFFWWWVIHLWVEGVWELIAAALYALLLIRLFNFPRERAAKYVYIEAGLVLFTGIVGTGHHYYWIGTPQYWLLLGGMFSAFEVLPLLVMTFDALRVDRERSQARFEHPNQVARLWLIGSVILHLVGAGIWGFIQTLPSVNRWTHGTQMTTAHGHLAFYGAYAMLIIAIVYYALPRMRFGTDFFDQRRGKWAFWIAGSGMLVMTLAMSFAGILQVYFERVAGRPYMEAQAYLGLFYQIRFWAGVMMAIGLVLFLLDVFALRPAHRVVESQEAPRRLAVQPTTIALILGLLLLLFPAVAAAHCDSVDGPVIKDARLALANKDVTPALKWVKKDFEPEVRAAFAKAITARSGEGDMEFFEVLVRLHREGEGAPYTGIKPAGAPVEPGIAAADRALESNSVKIAENAIREQLREGLAQAYQRVVVTRKHKDDSVEAGRAYVEAYVAFVHYVERLYEDATSTPVHAEEGALHAHVDPH